MPAGYHPCCNEYQRLYFNRHYHLHSQASGSAVCDLFARPGLESVEGMGFRLDFLFVCFGWVLEGCLVRVGGRCFVFICFDLFLFYSICFNFFLICFDFVFVCFCFVSCMFLV